MDRNFPLISFYIPKEKWPSDYIPDQASDYWNWYRSRPSKWLAMYHWTLQTYLFLKEIDFPCKLTDTLPESGIIVSHRYFLPTHLRPNANQLLVCLRSDAVSHLYAQIHIVQNRRQATQGLWTIQESYFVPHWPQPSLIKRAPERELKFENIAFFGYENNLATELQGPRWREQIEDLGLKWHTMDDFRKFNDYSFVDAILAVRNFHSKSQHTWKPATKLYNAWRAGVPAVLGQESAFRDERRSALDYLEVNSLESTIQALKRLRDDVALRSAMIENAKQRAEEVDPLRIAEIWKDIFLQKVVPAYDNWCSMPQWQQKVLLRSRRTLYSKIDNFKRRFGLSDDPKI